MKIVLVSHAFSPQVGGIESVSKILAEEWAKSGHEVVVLTSTLGESEIGSYRVVRAPSFFELWSWVKWGDLLFHNNISLRYFWPLILLRRPWGIVHHLWIRRVDGTLGWQDQLKRYLLRFAFNGANSLAISQSLPGSVRVVGNPYDSELFQFKGDQERKRDFLFVGRFVSDKGIHLLLEAFDTLIKRGYQSNLTLIGKGPEESVIRLTIQRLGLEKYVFLKGELRGKELVDAFHEHRYLVVPSIWEEPFGLVAVEGIACGCFVIAAEGGGMREAAGEGAWYFLRGNCQSLRERMESVLNEEGDREWRREKGALHIKRFEREQIALSYLELMR